MRWAYAGRRRRRAGAPGRPSLSRAPSVIEPFFPLSQAAPFVRPTGIAGVSRRRRNFLPPTLPPLPVAFYHLSPSPSLSLSHSLSTTIASRPSVFVNFLPNFFVVVPIALTVGFLDCLRAGAANMVNPSTESILNQMTNLAMDIAMDYVLPASPMSDVSKSDLFEFEREVVAAANGDLMLNSLMAGTAGIASGCCGRPPMDLCKKNSYMGAAGCDSCDACLARHSLAAAITTAVATTDDTSSNHSGDATGTRPLSKTTTAATATSAPLQPQTAETTMDISWCQFDGCEFDTADNSYLDICDWIFYADRYSLTDENREKVQKAFQMVPPGEVTGYVAEPPSLPPPPPPSQQQQQQQHHSKSTKNNSGGAPTTMVVGSGVTVKSEPVDTKREPNSQCELDDDYLWTSDNHLQPIILKAEPNADILQITELDHSYLQTGTNNSCSVVSSATTVVSPVKHHPNHLVDMLGLVTPPPSRSQSSGE